MAGNFGRGFVDKSLVAGRQGDDAVAGAQKLLGAFGGRSPGAEDMVQVPKRASDCPQCEDMRRRLARAIVVIEALRKKVADLEGMRDVASTVQQLGVPLGVNPGSNDPRGARGHSNDPRGGASGGSPLAQVQDTSLMSVRQELDENRKLMETMSLEAAASRNVVIELEAQLAERDAQIVQLDMQLQGEKRRVDALRGTTAQAPKTGQGGDPRDGTYGVLPPETTRDEMLTMWDRVQSSLVDAKRAQAAKEAMQERLHSEMLGREAFEIQRLRLQRLHEQMVSTVEERRRKLDSVESNWGRSITVITEAQYSGMIFTKPLTEEVALALGFARLDDSAGQIRLVAALRDRRDPTVEVYAKLQEPRPALVIRSTAGYFVEQVDSEYKFVVFGFAEGEEADGHLQVKGNKSKLKQKGPTGKAQLIDVEDDDDEGDWDDDVVIAAKGQRSQSDLPGLMFEFRSNLSTRPQDQFYKWQQAFRQCGLLQGDAKGGVDKQLAKFV